jgi:hypothetical protein
LRFSVLSQMPGPAAAEQGGQAPHRRGRDLPRPRDAIIRLVGAVLAEQNDEWTESRGNMGLEILAACRKAAQQDAGQNVTSGAGLTIEANPA